MSLIDEVIAGACASILGIPLLVAIVIVYAQVIVCLLDDIRKW